MELTWAEKHPNKKLINTPVTYAKKGNPHSTVHVLIGAVMRSGFENEGSDYFNDDCNYHNGHSCGGFWLEVSGLLNKSYVRRKAAIVRQELALSKEATRVKKQRPGRASHRSV